MANKVLLLYGSGPNVGAGVIKKFAAHGWKTAAIVRTMKDEHKGSADLDLALQVDFADAQAIQKIYSEVESKLGTPNCVVYNGYSFESFSPGAPRPFVAPPEKVAKDLIINTVGCYAAASSAAAGFEKAPSGSPKVFIYTGNGFPTSIVPEHPGLGGGKAASAYLIETAANALKESSHWYFADERLPTGKPVMRALDGEAHGDVYYDLAMGKEQGPWNFTFVKGIGYRKFPDTTDHAYTPYAELMANIGK